jgi:D-sedoheptulose 7-phosphate isomerase
MNTPDLSAWLEPQLEEVRRIQQFLHGHLDLLAEIAQRMAAVFRSNGRVFFFGNGGSAADAQHWAAELTGRFYLDRPPLPALSLATNTSQITAIANDFGYENTFSLPLLALGHAGDMAVGISTSGHSANVLKALSVARERGLVTVGFTGQTGGAMATWCDYLIRIPSGDVARIQEAHEVCAHLICGTVERILFGDDAHQRPT